MLTKHIKTIVVGSICFVLILVAAFSTTSLTYASSSPFVGEWFAIDLDWSDIRLTIAGPAHDQYKIVWTENYFSYCGGKAGIMRGKGWLIEDDVMFADLTLKCFTTGESLELEFSWIYDPGTDTISSDFITWHRAQANSKPCIPPPAGMSGWWPGDGNSNDLIYGNRGIFMGDATIGSGLVDLAFKLDGSNDFIEIPDAPALNFGSGDFTVDLWVNFEDVTFEQVLIEKWIQGDGYVDGWTLTKLEGNILRLALDNGSGGDINLDSGELDIHPGTWYHFAATRQGQQGKLFMNGVVIADQEIGASNINSPVPLKFGHRGNPLDTPGLIDERGFYLNGRIDEVEIFVGTALPEEQIMGLYAAGSAGKCKDAIPPLPLMNLRVNYGDDWVESFYEAGHEVKVMVTESDGRTVKATAELVTEPKEFWGGATGFQTSPEDWIPGQPDIQPSDWVYAWVDKKSGGHLQVGEISAKADLEADSIAGTINAPWLPPNLEVLVECHSWGTPLPEEILVYDRVFPDGIDNYSCSWAEAWDIQPGQLIGVSYFDAYGNWVVNNIQAPNPVIIASEAGDWFWTTNFYPGSLDISIYENINKEITLWSGQAQTDGGGFVVVGKDVHGLDLVPGNYVEISDGVNAKGIALQPISITVFGTDNDVMAGYAPPGSEVTAAAGPLEWQERISVFADPETGYWMADFKEIGFDITEDMRWSSFAQIFDEDGDANEGSTPPPPSMLVWLDWNTVDGDGWGMDEEITLTIGDLVLTQHTPPDGTSVHFDVSALHDIVPGDLVKMSNGITAKELVVPLLSITDYDLGSHTISGIYDPALGFRVYVYGQEFLETSFTDNTWVAFFDKLQPLQWGDAVQTDEHNNSVAATIRTPNPRFYVVPDEDVIYASEWSPDQQLTVIINGEEVMGQPVPNVGSPYGPEVRFDLPVDLVVGDTVILSDGRYNKELVVPLLQVLVYDFATYTLSGLAAPGELFIGVNEIDFTITVGADGIWFVSSPYYESGQWGSAIITDEDGDQTRDIFMIPYPNP